MLWALKTAAKMTSLQSLVMRNSMSMSKQHPQAACLNPLVPVFARKFSLAVTVEALCLPHPPPRVMVIRLKPDDV